MYKVHIGGLWGREAKKVKRESFLMCQTGANGRMSY